MWSATGAGHASAPVGTGLAAIASAATAVAAMRTSRYRPVRIVLHLKCRRHPCDLRSSIMLSAVRSASADSVSVGLAVPPVGNVPLPTRYRLLWSWERWNESTTDVFGLSPIR